MRSRKIRIIRRSLPSTGHVLTPRQLRCWLRELPRQQRQVFRRVLQNRCTRRYAAHQLGLSPGSVSRWLASLTRRLHNDLSRALITHRHTLPHQHYVVGVSRYIRGENACQICQAQGISRHQFYLIIADLRGWYFGLIASQPAIKPALSPFPSVAA